MPALPLSTPPSGRLIRALTGPGGGANQGENMKTTLQSAVGIVAAVLIAACGSSQSRTSTTSAQAQSSRDQPAMGTSGCPLIAETTTVRAEDVEGGAALVFTTEEGDPDAIRSRAEQTAEMHNEHHGPDAADHEDQGMMDQHPNMHRAEARAEDIEGGARVVFELRDDGDVEGLREEVRMHAQNVAAGECPMMEGGHGHHGYGRGTMN